MLNDLLNFTSCIRSLCSFGTKCWKSAGDFEEESLTRKGYIGLDSLTRAACRDLISAMGDCGSLSYFSVSSET